MVLIWSANIGVFLVPLPAFPRPAPANPRTELPLLLLERIVVPLDPVPVRVLQVNLFHLVGSYLRRLGRLRPVAIFNIEIIQVFRKDAHVRDTESEVYIDVVGDIFPGARYD